MTVLQIGTNVKEKLELVLWCAETIQVHCIQIIHSFNSMAQHTGSNSSHCNLLQK